MPWNTPGRKKQGVENMETLEILAEVTSVIIEGIAILALCGALAIIPVGLFLYQFGIIENVK